jgi:hypothetical protein
MQVWPGSPKRCVKPLIRLNRRSPFCWKTPLARAAVSDPGSSSWPLSWNRLEIRIVSAFASTRATLAAGYDIRTEDAYEQTVREFDRIIGLGKIRAFHLNDCKKDLGCHVDRHTHIGKGCIGLEAFRCLVNDKRFAAIPKILETPKGTGNREDKRNLATLRKLVV